MQELHALRAAPFQNVALALAPRTFVEICKSCTESDGQQWRSGTVLDREGAALRLIRGVEIPKAIFWHASGSSNCCRPTRQFPR
eukprot:3582085-Pyramimonas_sp.AAC.1